MTSLRVRWISTAVLAALGIFLIYYAYRAFGQLYPFAFGDPTQWENHWMVKGAVSIPIWLRASYFAVWSISIVATCLMLWNCIYLVNMIRLGTYFNLRTIRGLQRVGTSAVIAGLAIMVASSLWPWMITLQNTVDKRGMRLAYDSSEAGIVLIGAGVFMLAWVLKTAVLMRQENEEMV